MHGIVFSEYEEGTLSRVAQASGFHSSVWDVCEAIGHRIRSSHSIECNTLPSSTSLLESPAGPGSGAEPSAAGTGGAFTGQGIATLWLA